LRDGAWRHHTTDIEKLRRTRVCAVPGLLPIWDGDVSDSCSFKHATTEWNLIGPKCDPKRRITKSTGTEYPNSSDFYAKPYAYIYSDTSSTDLYSNTSSTDLYSNYIFDQTLIYLKTTFKHHY
jgi:hypothetical protein